MKSEFKSTEQNPHIADEEKQWAETLASGNSFAGLLLVYDQKLCGLVHELEKAFKAKQLKAGQAGFWARCLASRTGKVLRLMQRSGHAFKAEKKFQNLKKTLESVEGSEKGLALLQKTLGELHTASHLLCNEMHALTRTV